MRPIDELRYELTQDDKDVGDGLYDADDWYGSHG